MSHGTQRLWEDSLCVPPAQFITGDCGSGMGDRDQAHPFYVGSPSLPLSCQVKTPDESRSVGRISKQWGGLLREALTDTDDFGLQFPLDLDVRVKAVLLGATFLIVSRRPLLLPPLPLCSHSEVLSASWPPARRGSETESLGVWGSRPGF